MSDASPAPDVLPYGQGVQIWRVAVVMPFVTFAFVALRFYSRLVVLKKRLVFADCLVAATMLSIITYSVLICNATYNGMGLHIWQFTPALTTRYYFWIAVSSMFYVLSLMGFKSSLILFYLEIFGVNRRFSIACYITLAYTVSYLLCNLITQFASCTPVAKIWQSNLPGHCINTVVANTIYGFGHMSSDLVIAILPIPMIWRLDFCSMKQKIGVTCVLCCGFIAWAIACIRWAISTYDQLTYDRPGWAGIAFFFSVLEVNTGLICACIGTMGPVLSLAFSGKWSTERSRSTAQHPPRSTHVPLSSLDEVQRDDAQPRISASIGRTSLAGSTGSGLSQAHSTEAIYKWNASFGDDSTLSASMSKNGIAEAGWEEMAALRDAKGPSTLHVRSSVSKD